LGYGYTAAQGKQPRLDDEPDDDLGTAYSEEEMILDGAQVRCRPWALWFCWLTQAGLCSVIKMADLHDLRKCQSVHIAPQVNAILFPPV
jgi:hypothetical protein